MSGQHDLHDSPQEVVTDDFQPAFLAMSIPPSAVLSSALQTLHHDLPPNDETMDLDDGGFYGPAHSMHHLSYLEGSLPTQLPSTSDLGLPFTGDVPTIMTQPSAGDALAMPNLVWTPVAVGVPEGTLGADDGTLVAVPGQGVDGMSGYVASPGNVVNNQSNAVGAPESNPFSGLTQNSSAFPSLIIPTYSQLVGSGMLAVDAYDSADMVDLDGFQLEDFERNLDFIRFVEQWYFRAGLPAGGYPKISDEAIDIRNWVRPTLVTREELDGDRYDVQGIDWAKIGVLRDTARRVRRKLYHNYTNIQPRPLGLPYVYPPSEMGNYFSFRSLNTQNVAHLSHFQLRNLLCCASRSDLFYAGKTQIFAMDPITNTRRVIMDLSKPTVESFYPGGWKTSTLTATHGVLIVGGFGGEYAMVSLDAPLGSRQTEGLVTTDDNGITNYVHTYLDRTHSHPQAIFCSNDKKVRILDCYTNNFVKEHDYDWPVNCAATSPDGRLRVVVGDDTCVTISDAESGRSLQVLRGHHDYGFACAWADDGVHVATGNQDKQVRIYDARNWSRPLSIFHTEMAGARALRFSPIGGGRRILLVAEPADIIHAVDARLYETKQRLDQFGEIAGISFTPDGDAFYAANSDDLLGGIMEYERTGYGEEYGALHCGQHDDDDGSDDDDDDDELPEPSWDWATEPELRPDARVARNACYRRRRGMQLNDSLL